MRHTCGPWRVGGCCAACEGRVGGGPVPVRPHTYGDLQDDHAKVKQFDLDVHVWEDDKPARHDAFGRAWQKFKGDWDKWYYTLGAAQVSEDQPVPNQHLGAVADYEKKLADMIESGKDHGVQSPVDPPDLRGFVAKAKSKLEAALPWLGGATAAIALWRTFR